MGLKDAAKTATRFETARQQLQAYSEHKTFKGVFSEAQKKWLETKMDPEMAKIADHVRNNPQTGPASLTPTQRKQFINYVQDFFKNMQVPADE